jgi:NAD(P)H-flavin reductase
MSQYLDSLQVGDSADMRGPFGRIEYIGRGRYRLQGKEHFMKRCAMVAGGTGITPMYQVIRAILDDPDDPTEVALVFANKSPRDIMLRPQLDRWARDRPNFKVWYVVSNIAPGGHDADAENVEDADADAVADAEDANADGDAVDAKDAVADGHADAVAVANVDVDDATTAIEWSYSIGRIDEDILRAHLPAGSPETSAFLCGPLSMMESASIYLDNFGYERARCHRF